jgi:hypothetical protein
VTNLDQLRRSASKNGNDPSAVRPLLQAKRPSATRSRASLDHPRRGAKGFGYPGGASETTQNPRIPHHNPRADIDLAAPPEQPHRRSQTHGIPTRIPPKKLTCVGSGRNRVAAPPPPPRGRRRLRGGRGRLAARVSGIQQQGWIKERRGDKAARWARWWPVCVCAALRPRLGGAQDTSSRREGKRRRL